MNILMTLGYKELYFIILNASCIAILVYLWVQWSKQKKDSSIGRKIVYSILIFAVIFCGSDMVSGVLQDYNYKGSYIILYISNMIYYSAIVYASVSWALYAMLRVNIINKLKPKQLFVLLIPSLLFLGII